MKRKSRLSEFCYLAAAAGKWASFSATPKNVLGRDTGPSCVTPEAQLTSSDASATSEFSSVK